MSKENEECKYEICEKCSDFYCYRYRREGVESEEEPNKEKQECKHENIAICPMCGRSLSKQETCKCGNDDSHIVHYRRRDSEEAIHDIGEQLSDVKQRIENLENILNELELKQRIENLEKNGLKVDLGMNSTNIFLDLAISTLIVQCGKINPNYKSE